MRRPWQYTLLGAAIAFFVLYGIELSSDGMEDVYGPMDTRDARYAGTGGVNGYGYDGDPNPARERGRGPAAQADPYEEWPGDSYGDTSGTGGGAGGAAGIGGAAGRNASGTMPDRTGGYGYPYEGSGEGGGAVGRLADGTAGLLQSMAKSGIRFIVSLFDSVTQ